MFNRETQKNWMKSQVAHSLRGRLRLRVEGLNFLNDEKEEIAQEIGLGSVANMQSMYGDVATESFLLTEKVAAFLADNAVEK